MSLVAQVFGSTWDVNPDSVKSAASTAWSSTQVELAIRRFVQTPDTPTFGELIKLAKLSDLLSLSARDRLNSYIRDVLGETQIRQDPASIEKWWAEIGIEGKIGKRSDGDKQTASFKWISPVEDWLSALRYTASEPEFQRNRERLLPKLLAAAQQSQLVSGGTNDVSFGISEAERSRILSFFQELARDADKARPLGGKGISSPADLKMWWENDGRRGELYRGSNGMTRWRSFAWVIGDRLSGPSASMSDVCLGVSLATGKQLNRPFEDSDWQTRDLENFKAVVTEVTEGDRDRLLVSLTKLAPNHFEGAAPPTPSIEAWWSSVGRRGSLSAQGGGLRWVSPIDAFMVQLRTNPSTNHLQVLEELLNSKGITADERSLLIENAIPSCVTREIGGAVSGRRRSAVGLPESRAKEWIEFVKVASKAYGDAKIADAGSGMLCQYSSSWVAEQAQPGSPPEAMHRLAALFRLLNQRSKSNPNYPYVASELRYLTKWFDDYKSEIPESEPQWNAFLGGAWNGASWSWTRP